MISVRILLSLDDFKSLGDIALVDLTNQSVLKDFKKGDTLPASDYQNKEIYLLSGHIEVTGADHKPQVIVANEPRAQHPVFRLRLPGFSAKCKQNCTLLLIDKSTYEKYVSGENIIKPNIEVVEIDYNTSDSESDRLIAEIEKKFLRDEVTLPSLPEIAIHIQNALIEQEISFNKLAGVIQSDPAITARILQVANSAIYGGVSEITSIQKAITQVGLDAINAIVISVVLRDLFKPNSVLVRKTMSRYYEHSIRIGVIAYVISKGIPGYDADRAFLAGLLHDIGVIPLLVVADSHPQLSRQAGHLETILEQLKSNIGSKLLQKWNFDDGLAAAALHAYDWQWTSTEKPDYVGLVQIALMHSSLVGGGKIKGPPLCNLPAFTRLGFDKVNPVDDLKTLKEVTQRVKEMIRILCN